jgi:hypothetical protein
MSKQRLIACLLLIATLVAGPLQAHFLFIRIGPHAEAGRSVEVFFSARAEAGDPLFVPKIAHTKLWMQETPGKFQPLDVQQASDRLRAFLPSRGAVSVVGECEYGVLQRDVAFLLQYYPKAIAGAPEKINALQARPAIPLEIMPRIDGKKITFTVLHKGKPLPKVKLVTVDDDLVNEELTTDEQGQATWTPEEGYHYCVYTSTIVKQAGKKKDRSYQEIRRFATIAFHWPLVRSGADAKAVAMFQKAIAARAAWKSFPGFTADIEGTVDGRFFNGKAKVDPEGNVELKLDEATATEWVEGQLGSIVLHRQASSSDGPAPVLRFADQDYAHPLGRLLTFVGGNFASSYRVKDNQIMVVNRNIGDQNFTITVLDNIKNKENQFLPRSYVIRYWDARTGKLNRTQTVLNRWQRIDKLDLPAELVQISTSAAGLTVRTFQLSNHKLLSPK